MPIKCAVFLSTVALYDFEQYVQQGHTRVLDCATDGELIQIPTVHIWGELDDRKKDCERVSMLCSRAAICVHGGAHEVPGLGVKETVTGCVNAIRRGILEAQTL